MVVPKSLKEAPVVRQAIKTTKNVKSNTGGDSGLGCE
jgi:hypothetical protein